MTTRTGFVGIGTMGEPMAKNLLAAGCELVVWNRTAARCDRLAALSAEVAEDLPALFSRAGVVILMLADDRAIDTVLGRGTDSFAERCRDRTLIVMGTTSASYSAALAVEVRSAGGRYVEAPVSGSRVPAERGELVCMLAGRDEEIESVRPLLEPICSRLIACGAEPAALVMKHATNMVLVPSLLGLAEGTAFARKANLDLELFRDVLLGGQMASDLLRAKLPKLLTRDYSPQGAVKNAVDSVGQTLHSAADIDFDPRLTRLCLELLTQAAATGLGEEDMIAVEKLME